MARLSPSGEATLTNPRGARVAADQGLSGLGMLMQLAGGIMAIVTLAVIGTALATHVRFYDVHPIWMYSILVLSLRRSLLQRRAGIVLVYGPGDQRHPQTRSVRRYIRFALGQSAVVLAILHFQFAVTSTALGALALALIAWPAILAVVLALPRFRSFREEIPMSEDQGFAGAAMYMTVFGLWGTVVTAIGAFVTLMKISAGVWPAYFWLFAVPPLVILLIRSILEVQGGLSGLRSIGIDRQTPEYLTFAYLMLIFLGLFITLSSNRNPTSWMLCLGIYGSIPVWPLAIRRFIRERRYPHFLAHYRPGGAHTPDAGLAWLGWLLLGSSVASASIHLLQRTLNAGLSTELNIGDRMTGILATIGELLPHSTWPWPVIALQLWAGLELVRMGRYAKIAASLYSGAATVTAISLWWPRTDASHAIASGLMRVLQFAPLSLALVLPIATAALVHRKVSRTENGQTYDSVRSLERTG